MSHCIVIGDLMLDTYKVGSVSRVSPEAPVPVITVSEVEHRVGGAGNLAFNLAALGLEVTMIGVVGCDTAGDHLRHLFEKKAPGIKFKPHVPDGHRTTEKVRFLADGQQLLREDHEVFFEDAKVAARLLSEEITDQTKAVIVSDYKKGFVCNSLQELRLLSFHHAIPVFVDPKAEELYHYRGIDVLKPNEKEFQILFGDRATIDDDQAVFQVLKDLEIKKLFVTRGALGIKVFNAKSGIATTIPAMKTSVFDVTGAGDTALAAIVYSHLKGYSDIVSCQIANKASGSVVSKVGTSVVNLEDVQLSTEKVINRDCSVIKFEDNNLLNLPWSSEQIVFTNGCFDLLHPGHLHLLQCCREYGQRLVVGLNSDQSIKLQNKLYSDLRPIDDLDTRISKLISLGIVDAIIIFDDVTPLKLINNLNPDVLVKGGDYDIDKICGSDVVQKYGGLVISVDTVEQFSTTSQIEAFLGVIP